ncbi:MAG: type 1 glutamine amidotransferase [Candidatus Omnitrophica bacterium]|nr:type 1 glutamine amidotransferase [Candidatus Omnitrophota bacterium]
MILFIKHVDIEGPETLGAFFVENHYKLGVVDLHRDGRLPDSLADVDAVVSLGGPMNVYEEARFPFLKDEDVLLKKVLAAGIPFLGICLGAQLLAKAAGGKVTRSPQEEIGWFTVDLTDAGGKDPLFQGLPKRMEVYQWHGDMCVLPDGAELLSTAERCSVQAFRVGKNAYGLQFHAEITDKSIDEWSRDYAPEKRAEREKMLSRYREIRTEFDRHGRILCENFLKCMKRV